MILKSDGRILILLFCVTSILSAANATIEKSPKIITNEGNVILEAGINKNITISLKGRSRLLVNDLDLMGLLVGEKFWITNTSSELPNGGIGLRILQEDVELLKSKLVGRRGLNSRLSRLFNRTTISNPANVLRRTQRRLTSLETRVQSIMRKLNHDNCEGNPCDNGGTCINLFDDFLCKCNKGFEGPTCSGDVNECALFIGTDLGCQNGAQCINQFGSYSCICPSGWQGMHCTQRKTDCLHSSNTELCGHGTCVNVNNNFGYSCMCEQGWTTNGLTPACSVDVDECKEYSSPCSTKCINLPGSYMCAACEAGYTGNGLSCRDIDECATDNGGCSVNPFVPCINSYGSFHCGECPIGWSGDGRICTRTAGSSSCTRNNICHPMALCSEVANSIVCSCPSGQVGNGVGPYGCRPSGTSSCTLNPCLNGGTCMDIGSGSYICICPLGFKPPNCDRLSNPCATNPCRNGGTCRPTSTNFTCDCVEGYGGRLCASQRSRCGQYITAEQGNLKYPLNNLYNHNTKCSWVIRTNETKVLNITFSKFDIEDSVDCRFDWLQIHDGQNVASQLIGRFCGTTAPMGGNIITTSNSVHLWFKSDNTTTKAGFDLFWTSIDPICGGLKEFDSHATIASPGSPGNYPRNRDCKWHLKVPNNNRIKLVFFSLKIENHSDCNHDFLEISDAVSGSRLEIFCNSSNPSPFTVPSSEIFVHFHSDNEGTDVGFQIHASTIERIPGCGGTYTERNGQIISPIGFQGSMSCEYTIRYPLGLRVQIDVVEFNMGDEDCIEIFDVNSSGDKASTGKWCGKMHVPTFKSKSNAVQINYFSQGGTFKLSYGTICEYTFEDPTGTITSPNYPSPYPSDEICSYEIIGDAHQVVSLEFEDMDIESHKGMGYCWFDYIIITDGTNETAAGPFCGKTIPSKIVTNTSLLKLTLRSDSTNAGKGFKANYALIDTSKDCGGLLRKSSGIIRLPVDPRHGTYKDDLSCTWTIMAPEGYGIQLTWESFKLEESNDCLYDYIEIFDTDQVSTFETIASHRLCGSTMPPALVSTSNLITLRFTSDSSDSEDGFVARYTFVDASTLCSGNIFSSTGQLKSINWPNDYPNDMNCTWTISVQPSHQIELLISSFDLEESENCTNDWMEIRNGGSFSSPLIGKYCGQSIPSRIPSFTHQIHLTFKSNSQIVKSGFRIKWQTISSGCGGILTADHGSIASPFYPQNYATNAQCEWRVSVSKGSTISIVFEDLVLESLMSCSFDFIDIFDGLTPEKRKIGRYCEQTVPPITLETTGSNALIRFKSDSTETERGFYIVYKTNCNRILNSTIGAIESPNFGDNNPSTVNCTWKIQAPRGSRIAMDFAIVGRKDSSSKLDFVYVIDENGTVIRLNEAKRIESHASEVQIILNSTSIYFSMEYAMKGCVGNFHRPTGEFSSPGYPNAYPSGTDCRWQIETDIGKAIELVFIEIDIGTSVNCTHKYIEIWNTAQMSRSLGRFCGKRNNLTITSSGHSLYVQFNAGYSLFGKGFKAKYKAIESKCGGNFALHAGTIHSPNYPNNYDSNLHCEWNIQVSQHSTMTLTIDELDLEQSYQCSLDALKIYLDTSQVDENHPWKSFCGEDLPVENKFQTTSNSAMILFESDEDTEHKGFKISFKENCGKRIIVNDTGRIRFDKLDQTECIWVFVAEDIMKHVTLTTTHVQRIIWSTILDKPDDCNGVMIYDGDFTNTRSIHHKQTFCGKHLPAVTSLGHALTMKINSSLIDELEVHYSIMDNSCGGSYDSLHGTIASPYYPLSYPINIECIWEIKASEGNWLSLTIQQMDIENSEDCNSDYLEVREGASNGRLIEVFCGEDTPNPVLGFNSLWIKFKSDNDIVRKGFIAEYSYAFDNEINGTEGIIESPRYPSLLAQPRSYTWRISVPRGYLILISLESIAKSRMLNYVEFFNGYDSNADAIQIDESNIIRSDTNHLFIKATLTYFRLHWYRVSKDFMASNKTTVEESLTCSNKIISVGAISTIFQSPGFPEGYESNLNCSWTLVPIDLGSHAVVKFQKIDLEDQADCLSDSVNIYSSIDMTNWKLMQKACKMKSNTDLQIAGDKFLKIEFVTDFGVNRTGFSASALSRCGSTLTGPTGVVNATKYSVYVNGYNFECIWQIQVKTGRKIKITFLESKLESRNEPSTSCQTYVLLKNGFSEHSPNLGSGKYCDSNIPDIPITSSNEAYIKLNFGRVSFAPLKISFKYEEVMNECMKNIELNENQASVIVQSDNYPNIPHPHTMCAWNIRGPIHRLLAINFIDSLNLKRTEFCDAEYVQLNDGLSELSPVIERFCGKLTPNTQFTRGNNLRLTFFTDIAEPSAGFKVNVSLNICGGTYRQRNGTISSPKLMGHYVTDKNFSCDYTISVPYSFSVNLTMNSLHLPWTENCSEVNHLIITPVYDEGENATSQPIVLCGDYAKETYIFDTNNVQISYRIVSKDFDSDAFSFTYASLGHRCDHIIEAESGILKSPGYTYLINVPMRCKWKLRVPKGRRIKVEFLEFQIESTNVNSTNINNYRFPGWLYVYNDFDVKSTIARYSSRSPPPPVIYSTDNIMSLVSIEVPRPRKEGFKIRFSSDEESIYCNENFDKPRGDMHFKVSQNTTVFCRYDIDVNQNETFAISVSDIKVSSAIMHEYFSCVRNSPLSVQDMSGLQKMHWFCGNRNDSTLRLPYPIMFDISSNVYNNLTSLDLTFSRHSCGGVFTLGNQFQLHEPLESTPNYGVMDCAWKVLPNPGDLDQFEVSLSVNFKLKCDEEYLILYSDSKVNAPHLGRFCNQAAATNLVSTKNLFIEYHTSNYSIESKFNLTAESGTGCGGELTYPFRIIDFRKQYQNNVECVWTMRVQKEYHIGVLFSGRFFIESSPNCTKDYILIQEQLEDEWRDIQTICGRTPPAFVNSTSNVLRLIFRSDESGLGDGFTASFTRNCGGNFYASKDLQQLSSPNYPLAYDANLNCNYTIHPSKPDTNFLVQFKDFILETSPTDLCMYDKLTVYLDSEEPLELCGIKDQLEFRTSKPISLVFKSDGSFNRKGFQLEFGEQVCGGKITSNTVISTPKLRSNDRYPPSAECIWNITAPQGSKIVVKFEKFEFEGSYACTYDYVEVFSGKLLVEDQRLAKLCGNLTEVLPHLSIKSNMAIIHSVSDQTEHSIGFTAIVKFVKNCDRNITLKDLTDTYTLDTFANGYENNLNCEILFTTVPGRQLVLEFKSFHTEESSDCDRDYVQIRDGAGPFADEIGKFCGHEVPNSVMSSRSNMFVNFITDSSDISTGFLATVRSIPLACGAHELFVETNKTVSIKIGGDENYLPNLNCFWHIRSDNNIRLDFEKIDIQGPDAHGACTTDYLKIYNKQQLSVVESVLGSDIIFNGDSGQAFTNLYENVDNEHVFCGQGVPEGYFTNNQEVFVKFFSDSTIEKSGFKIIATTAVGCFKNYTSTQGRILMETSADCNIYIYAPKNYSISLYFNYFYLYFGSDNDCKTDYIEIFDEQINTTPAKSLRKICGSVDPSNSVFSNSSTLRINIAQSGIFNNYDITFLATDKGPGCGGTIYNYAGVITSPFYPENARNNSDCQWNIRVPNNLAVSLEFKVFDLGSKVTCRSDYLEILERKPSNIQQFEVMRKFCGEDTPTTYIARQNTLSIRFHKTVNFDGTGWVIRFSGVRQRFSLV